MIHKNGTWYVRASTGVWVGAPTLELAQGAAAVVGANASITSDATLNTFIDGRTSGQLETILRGLVKRLIVVVPEDKVPKAK